MKKGVVATWLCLAIILGTFGAVAHGGETDSAPAYTDFMGKRFSILVGSLFDAVADEVFEASEKLYFNNTVEEIEAVRLGKTDAALMDDVAAAHSLASGAYEDLVAIPVPLPELDLPYGVFSSKADVIEQYNEFLAEIETDGTLADMQARWLTGKAAEAVLPDIPLTGENGTLTAAIMATYPPFTFAGADGEFTGFDVEQLRRFAAWLGMDIEFVDMDFGALLSYVASGKADIGGSVYATEERKEKFLFGNPDYVSKTVLVVKRTASGNAARDYTWFEGLTVGVHLGSITDSVMETIGATPAYYQETATAVEDLRNGRIAGFATDLSALHVLANDPGNEDLEVIEVPTSFFTGPMGAIASFESQALVDTFNAFLAKVEADGTLLEMQSRWFEGVPDLNAPMPELTYTGEKGVLRVATVGTDIPFDYFGADNTLKGYSIELMNRFAADTGYTVEYQAMEFGAQIPAVSGGRADMAISSISITEERSKSALFTDPVFYDQLGIITLKESVQQATDLTYEDFIGKTLAIKNGTIYDAISKDIMKASEVLFFEDYPSIYESIKNGKVDAGMRGYMAAYVSLFEPAYEDLALLTLPEGMQNNPIGAISMGQDTIDAFNDFLASIQADGTYDEMHARWLEAFDPKNIPAMPDIPLTGEKGTLTVAISSDYMPFSFLGDNGVNLGFDIELALRFAAHTGKDIQFVDMAFSGLLPYVVSGKADIAISDITITEERKKSVLFSDPYFVDLSAIIYRKDFGGVAVAEETSGGFIAWLANAIERNLITENRWKMIVSGLGVTMTISLLAQLLGTLLGSVLCWMLTRKNRLLSGFAKLYGGLIHGLPMVVLLMISYYIIFGKTDIPAMLIAVCAFALVEAASVAANLKGAIDTVDPVEIEAARSIGFSATGAFRVVTLPQAVKRALPAYCNGFIELVKATAIVGYIAIQDMTRAGDIIRSRTYDAYFPLLLVAVIYLLVTTICVQLFKLVVRKINREVR